MKPLLIAIGTLLVVLSGRVSAQGCDSCLQAAATTANTEMIAALQALQVQLELNTQQLESGLSTSAARIELTVNKLTKASGNQFESLITSIDKMYESQTLAREELNRDYQYGPQSMPRSLDIHADRALSLRQAWERQEQIWDSMQDKMIEHQRVDPSTRAKILRKALQATEGSASLGDLVARDQLSVDEIAGLDDLLKVLVSTEPTAGFSADVVARDPAQARKELQRRIGNAKQQFAYGVLSRSLIEMQPLIDRDDAPWGHTYVQSEGVEDGQISWREFLHDETQGRLQSESWFNDIRHLNKVGLMREQVVLQALRNHILARSVQREEELTVLMALLLSSERGGGE